MPGLLVTPNNAARMPMGFPPHFAQLQFPNNMPRVPLSMPNMPMPAQDTPVAKPAEPIVKQQERPKPPQEQPPLPKEEEAKLPPHWRTAKDAEGKTYFYHALTRETQWDPPTADTSLEKKVETIISPVTKKKKREVKKDDMMEIESPVKEMKSTTPVKKDVLGDMVFNTSKVPVDEGSKKSLALFKSLLAKVVVNNLGKYNKVDCKVGRIMDSADFKYLARKLTHGLTEKEMQRKTAEELSISDSLKQRVKLYIHSYMEKFGPIYHRT